MLDFVVVERLDTSHLIMAHLEEAVDGRCTDVPVQSRHHMTLHLREHVLLVELAAHRGQLLYAGYLLAALAIFGGNQKGGAADELVVSSVDDPLGTVSIEDVDCKEESLGLKPKGSMGFDQEVEQVRTHEPLNLGLKVDGSNIGEGLDLQLV